MRRCRYENCRHVNRRDAVYCGRCGRNLRPAPPPVRPSWSTATGGLGPTRAASATGRARRTGGAGLFALGVLLVATTFVGVASQRRSKATFDVEAYREDHRQRRMSAIRIADRATRRQLARERGRWAW